VIAAIGGQTANLVHEKNLVFVLASRQFLQMQMLRLLDGSEDSPLPGRKQATPSATLPISLEL
jgi:hypothetical protein